MKKMIRIFVFLLSLSILMSGFSCISAGETAADSEEQPFIDLDLAGMSGTIVYAQVYNLLSDPSPWLGKMIRMAGYYSYYDDQEHGIVYHACVIPDATACCSAGIEFVWEGEHAWPEDYPEIGTDIVVTGRLEIYQEDGYDYLHLLDAKLVLNQSREAQP